MSGTREHQEMSTTSKNLFTKVRRIVPPLLEKFHKGQQGRVAVIGGSADYTGAPYFSAIASAKLGCDMSHVICAQSAAQVIKSYSPNLMVHPILQSSETLTKSTTNPMQQNPQKLAEPIISMMPRLHVLVIGPGLGRDSMSQKVVAEVIKNARSQKMPVVLDADGIQLVQEDPDLVRGFHECIITPNVVEFGRLAKALGVDISVKQDVPGQTSQQESRSRESEACERLSSALGGVLIIQKGKHDVISNGITSIITDIEGGRKRSGGQGDTLTGSLGTLLAWRKAYHEKLWDAGEKDLDSPPAETREAIEAELTAKESDKKRLSPRTTLLLVAWAGSAITRECSRRAFVAKGRSMQASDLTDEVHGSFLSLIGEPEASKL